MFEKILLIGQFSKPLTGMQIVNEVTFKILDKNLPGFVKYIDTNLNRTVSTVGKFSIFKVYYLFLSYLKISINIFFFKVIYITPGHSYLGVMRFLPILLLCLILGKKVFIHHHGYGIYNILKNSNFFSYFFLNSNFNQIVLTEDLKNKLNQLNANLNTKVINNFSTIKAKYIQKKNKRLNIIFLSNLIEKKGYKFFVEASEILNNCDFHLCGRINKDSKIFLKKYQTLKNLKIHGEVDTNKKKLLLDKADLLVLLTNYETEGVPLCILEGMSRSCGIITTKHNGIPETVGESGIFISQDLNDLVNCIDYFDKNRDELDNRQRLSHRQYLNNFNIKDYILRIKEVLIYSKSK